MGGDGKVLLDFGPPTGTDMATVDVSGQVGLVSASRVEAWVLAEASADHSIDEHLIEELDVKAGWVVDGTLRVYGRGTGQQPLVGQFNVGWVWTS
jgi:hypothetical protein